MIMKVNIKSILDQKKFRDKMEYTQNSGASIHLIPKVSVDNNVFHHFSKTLVQFPKISQERYIWLNTVKHV